MCAKLKTQFLILTTILATGLQASAQSIIDQSGPKTTKENSPYSRYGIGDLANQRNSLIRGMGGAATAYTDGFSVNSFNPASYSFLNVTTLDFAFEARTRSIFMNGISTNSGTATIAYFTLGIPLGKHAGMAIGLAPMSNVYYNSSDTVNINGIGKSVVNYNGSGSLQYAYLGLAGKIGGLSIGANGGYVFGTTTYTTSLTNRDTVAATRNTEFNRFNDIKGLYWKGGAIYQIKLKKEQYINIGAAITLSQKLTEIRDIYQTGYNVGLDSLGASGLVVDTVAKSSTKGKVEMPLEYSFGFHYGKPFAWDIGADYVYTDWSKFNEFGDRTGIGQNAYRASLGFEFTPDSKSRSLFSMSTYRLGAYIGKDYLNINNTNINYFGGTIGASFPLKRNYNQFGRINTALEIGKRGTSDDGLAKEVYVRFTFGVSLNDVWFIKRKLQ